MEGIFVPLFGCVMIVGVVIGPMWVRSYFLARQREQMQATLRVAIEKGQPLPTEMIEALTQSTPEARPNSPESDLRRSVVMIGVGLGLVGLACGLYFGLSAITDENVGAIVGGSVAGAGAIPFMVGLAYLLLFVVNRRKAETAQR